MKRYILIFLVSTFGVTAFADADTDFYIKEFNSAKSTGNQRAIVETVANASLDDAGDFYVSALHTLLQQYATVTGNSELDAADDTAKLLAYLIGEAGPDYASAGADLWEVVERFSNPVVRSNALIALGKIGATDQLAKVVQLLKDLNTNRPIDKAAQLGSERVAFGAIQSLGSYTNVGGYVPIFFAQNSWYNFWVKNQAQESRNAITQDPAEPLTSIINTPSYSYTQKLLALEELETNEAASEEARANAAVEALWAGWRSISNEPQEIRSLYTIRKLALTMISEYGTSDERVYPLLNRSYIYGADEDEQIKVIQALKKLGSSGDERAAAQLASYLTYSGQQFDRGAFTKEDERLVRATIYALRDVRHGVTKQAIQSALNLNWSPSVREILKSALEAISE
ncbi:MAG: hypothetical protein LBQ77_05500 [Treponema sp.]|jgi:hypothetical protein|nr:hypothetical protein [Treponema sp.]